MKLNLGALRKARGLTQAELGQRVGVAQRTVAAYEGGERRPSIEVAKKLAQVLGVENWADIYDESDDVDGFQEVSGDG